jgi:hypothetical protein
VLSKENDVNSTLPMAAMAILLATFNPAILAAQEDVESSVYDDEAATAAELEAMRQSEIWASRQADEAKAKLAEAEAEKQRLKEELAAAKAKADTLEAVNSRQNPPSPEPTEAPALSQQAQLASNRPAGDPTWYRHTAIVNGRVKIPNLWGNPGLEWADCDDCWRVQNISEDWFLVRFGHIDQYLHRGGQSVVDPLGRGVYIAPHEFISLPTEDGEVTFTCGTVYKTLDGFRTARSQSQTLTPGIVGADRAFTIGHGSCP